MGWAQPLSLQESTGRICPQTSGACGAALELRLGTGNLEGPGGEEVS